MSDMTTTLQLNGTEAYDFANALFRPSAEMIERTRNNLSKINNAVSITRTAVGFEAEIDGLDLSFLEEMSGNVSISISTEMCLSTREPEDYSSGRDYDDCIFDEFEVENNDTYCDSEISESLRWAA